MVQDSFPRKNREASSLQLIIITLQLELSIYPRLMQEGVFYTRAHMTVVRYIAQLVSKLMSLSF